MRRRNQDEMENTHLAWAAGLLGFAVLGAALRSSYQFRIGLRLYRLGPRASPCARGLDGGVGRTGCSARRTMSASGHSLKDASTRLGRLCHAIGPWVVSRA